MNAEDTSLLTRALEETDKDGNDWFDSIDSFAEFLNKPTDQVKDTYNRYKRVEGLMTEVWNIRNKKYRTYLESRNMKHIDLGDGNIGEVVDSSSVKRVYDPDSGSVLDEVPVGKGKVVVKLQNPLQDATGALRRTVLVNADSVKALPHKVLNQRKGHIDRFYRDTGWTVKQSAKRVVDDVEETYDRTTHIVKTEKEAKEVIAREIANGANPEDFKAIRARENDELEGIYGDDSSVSFGYSGAHTKQRGTILKGSDGMEASTAGVIESISRTVSGIERQLDTDIVNSLRTRFMNEFSEYMRNKGGTAYSGRFEDMFSKGSVPTDVLETAKQWHNYIESISRIKESEFFGKMNRLINGILKVVRMDGMVDVDTQKLSSLAQNFTTQMYIVGRPLFQIPQNMLQLVYVGQKYPVEGAKAVARMPSVISALRSPTKENIELLAKKLGSDEQTAQALVDDLRNNGLWDAVGMSDDFMRMVHRSSVDARPSKVGNLKSMGANALMSPLRASQQGQEFTLKLVNLGAYLAEFEKQVLKGGRKFNAKTKNDISFNVQKITQTQNSLNQFKYQDKGEIWSVAFQFTQHVHKLWLDIIADPMYKLATGKNLGKAASPLASSRLQAAGSLMATYAVFGPSGVFGNNVGGVTEDYIAQIENPYIRKALQANLLNTMLNGAVNHIVGAEGNVDLSAKMNPASFLDSLYEFHIERAINGEGFNVFGAVGSVAGQLGQTVTAVKTIASAPELGAIDKSVSIINDVLTNIAGVSDFERAYMAYHLGNYTYRGTLSGNLSVTKYEAIMQAFNLTPAVIEDRFGEFTGGGSQNKSSAQKVARIWIKEMHRSLAEANSYEEMMDIVSQYSSIAQASVDPLERTEVIKEMNSFLTDINDKTTWDYIKPYIDQKDLEDALFELRGLREDAGTAEMRQQIEDAILYLEPQVQQIKEFYEDK
jgi:hypothetical protein